MKNVMLVGGGKIGIAITEFLTASGDYRVTVVDRDTASLERMPRKNVQLRHVEIGDAREFAHEVEGHDIVLSATPYSLTSTVAEGAKRARAHYLDLTEDVETTRLIKKLAHGAETAFIPQCGLAPGFISIVAHDLASKFEKLREVQMRVGALPVFPHNALKYNLTWSTDGLINEYCNPCESIRDGRRGEVPALEEVEAFSLDGTEYEAFNTSGGLGTLCDTLEGKVENLNYKTVRYPGHRDIVKMLVRDLRLGMRREILKDVLETAIPITYQDVVLIFVTVSGWMEGRQENLQPESRRQVDERDPGDHRHRHLRNVRSPCRGQAPAKRFRAAGRSKTFGLPFQPLWALLRKGAVRRVIVASS